MDIVSKLCGRCVDEFATGDHNSFCLSFCFAVCFDLFDSVIDIVLCEVWPVQVFGDLDLCFFAISLDVCMVFECRVDSDIDPSVPENDFDLDDLFDRLGDRDLWFGDFDL